MAEPSDRTYSSSITIEELADGETRRLLVLAGPGLPFVGVPWGGEQGMATTWYPGNAAEATQTVFGPREAPTAMNGEWRRTTLPRSGSFFVDENGGRTFITTPGFLRDVMESIFRGGLPLRVIWETLGTGADQNRSLVRFGRARVWNFIEEGPFDIRWSAEFTWFSRGDKQAPVASREDNVTVASNDMTAAMDAAIAKYKALNAKRTLPTRFSLGQIEALANAPTALTQGVARSLQVVVNQFAQFGSIVGKMRSQPYAVANTAVNFAANTAALGNRFLDEAGRTPVEAMTLKSRVSDLARTYRNVGEMGDAVALVVRRAAEVDQRFRQTLAIARQGARQATSRGSSESDLLGTHVVKTGDTIERISQRWYGTPDRGVDILRANRLPWHQTRLQAGVPLIIPRLRAGQSNAV